MDFEQYIIQGEPGRKERAENWQVAIGLQAVDGLKPSHYLLQTAQDHIEERISIDEVERRIAAYYQTEEGRREEEGTDEADGVSARIARLLADPRSTEKYGENRGKFGEMPLSREKKQKSSEKILVMILEKASITTEQMAARLGISTRAVEKHLSNLKAKGLLRRIGPDKGGHWEVVIKN